MNRPVFFFFFLLLAFAGAQGQDSPEARAILEKVAHANQSGQSYRAEFSGRLEDKGTGLDRKLEFSGYVLSQPPDKLRAEMKVGPVEQWTIRDGARTWLYVPSTKKYRSFVSTAASIANLESLDPNSLFGVLTARLQSVQIAPEENVMLDGSPVRCYVISANYEPAQGGIQRRAMYWIDQMNYMVLRRKVEVPYRTPQYLEPLERTVELALTKLRFAPTLAGNEFVFTPPEGATAMVSPGASSAQAGSGTASSPQGAYRIGGGVSAPTVIYKTEPQYSEEARKARFQGTVVIALVVGEDGEPRNVRVLKSLGLGLDEKAMETVRAWRFAPGQKEGVPVPVLATIQVNFRLGDVASYWRLDGAIYNLPAGASRPLIVMPVFPPASPSRESGSATLALDVDEQGNPVDIRVEKSSAAKWEEELIAAVHKWKFEPGTRDGMPVRVPLRLEFSRVGEPAAPASPPANIP